MILILFKKSLFIKSYTYTRKWILTALTVITVKFVYILSLDWINSLTS